MTEILIAIALICHINGRAYNPNTQQKIQKKCVAEMLNCLNVKATGPAAYSIDNIVWQKCLRKK